jgi:hypothetical protein
VTLIVPATLSEESDAGLADSLKCSCCARLAEHWAKMAGAKEAASVRG